MRVSKMSHRQEFAAPIFTCKKSYRTDEEKKSIRKKSWKRKEYWLEKLLAGPAKIEHQAGWDI